MTKNPVGWFEIYVDDVTRARAFYEQVLAVKLERLPLEGIEMWAFPGDPEANGAGGTIVQASDVKPGGNSVLVYFQCEDCAVEESRVEAAGGRVLRPKMSIGEYGFVSLAFDTEGNQIGLHSRK